MAIVPDPSDMPGMDDEERGRACVNWSASDDH